MDFRDVSGKGMNAALLMAKVILNTHNVNESVMIEKENQFIKFGTFVWKFPKWMED